VTIHEQRETDERVKKSWDDGFAFGFWIALVGTLTVGGLAAALVYQFLK
jgi:hypothetical protein